MHTTNCKLQAIFLLTLGLALCLLLGCSSEDDDLQGTCSTGKTGSCEAQSKSCEGCPYARAAASTKKDEKPAPEKERQAGHADPSYLAWTGIPHEYWRNSSRLVRTTLLVVEKFPMHN